MGLRGWSWDAVAGPVADPRRPRGKNAPAIVAGPPTDGLGQSGRSPGPREP